MMAEKTPKRRDDITPRNEENIGDVADKNEAYERGRRDAAEQYRQRSKKPPITYDRRNGNSWLWPFVLLLLILLLIIGWYIYRYGRGTNIYNNNQNQQMMNQNQNQSTSNEQKTNNFSKSIPAAGDTIPAPTPSVLVQTTTASTSNSTITINMNNQDYGVGNTTITSNGMSLMRNLDPNAPDGTYTVNYKTCGSDGNCQNGNFNFSINRSSVNGYDDERNKSTANVTIANGKVYPDSLLVTKGTKIVFVNNTSGSFTLDGGLVGASGFFTTTSTISTGGSTSFTFNQAGYFPYTLVSGGETLNGKILVQ